MKIFLRTIGALLFLLLVLLKPVLIVISTLSGGVLSVVGIVFIFGGILAIMTMGVSVGWPGMLLCFFLGSICMLAGPFIAFISDWYDELHERLGDFVFNRAQNEDDFLM